MISIAMPAYNRAHLLPRSIKSVLDQEYQQWELLIVDDGSTDNTDEVVSGFLKDPRIKYIKKENTGAAHSRNVGVNHAQFEWITFLDSDDEAKPNWLSEVSKVIEEFKPRIVSCGNDYIDSEGELTHIYLPDANKEIFSDIKYNVLSGTFFLKRADFIKIGGYDAVLKSGQHTELSFRIIPYIVSTNSIIKDIQHSLIKVHIHKGERIRTDPKMKYEGVTYCLEKHKVFFEARPMFKSEYLGIAGYNAHLIGLKKTAIHYFIKSFYTKPSLKRAFRILLYTFKPTNS